MEKERDSTKNRRSEPEIKFKPLTEGLGFHPFSNGLPYAPVSKKPGVPAPATQGSGAVAAGPPRFVRPQTPIRTPAAPKAVQEIQPEPAPLELAQPEIRFGFIYLLKRVSAYVFDTAFHLLLASVAVIAMALVFKMPWGGPVSDELLIAASLIFSIAHWMLLTAQEVVFKTTLGKKIFGLALLGDSGAIFLRALAFPVSCLFFGLGLVWAIFDRKRRCWHDIVSKLQPLEIARL